MLVSEQALPRRTWQEIRQVKARAIVSISPLGAASFAATVLLWLQLLPDGLSLHDPSRPAPVPVSTGLLGSCKTASFLCPPALDKEVTFYVANLWIAPSSLCYFSSSCNLKLTSYIKFSLLKYLACTLAFLAAPRLICFSNSCPLYSHLYGVCVFNLWKAIST